ncbi:hypothetical protein ACIQPQ_02090 [Streptomyces sp. NPDC091281]|uniref:hypothetical protein n=1 Tax=Streptomyces sp. NPDC091281 TaxID=3365985 RepID=UPI003825EE0A
MAAPPGEPARTAGPVADFCAELRRLVRACGVPQTRIARTLNLSAASVSELLGGVRRTAPEWDVVRGVLGLCAQRCGDPPVPPPGLRLDEDWWRARHAELERTMETAPPRPRRSPAAPPAPRDEDDPPADVFGAAAMEVPKAVGVLAGGHPDDSYSLYEVLYAKENGARALESLLTGYPQRVRAARGVRRAELIHAARMVLLAVALARCGESGGRWDDMGMLVNGPVRAYGWTAHDDGERPPVPADPVLHEAVERLGIDTEDERELLRHYLDLIRPLADSCPEFALAVGLPPAPARPVAGPGGGVGLAGLGALLAEFVGRDEPTPTARALLHGPITSFDTRGPGPRLPTLAEGYVNPRYRLAGPGTPGVQDGAASDKWWRDQPPHGDIERFLAAHLLSLPALLAPLLVLGAPGAGKSMLTRLLQARAPVSEFRVLRVELRHVPAELDLQAQLEHALKDASGRDERWPDWSERAPGVLPLVLLDGFDELLQAGARRLDPGRQWNYLREVERFQRREAEQGRPLAVVVTSRTVVADRADIPPATQVLRLEPFDGGEIERWLAVWNTTNRAWTTRRGLSPLTPDALLPHRHLAAQPLLLLMLALYDADDNAVQSLREEDFSRTELYERLLTTFVRRQLVKDGTLPAAGAPAAVEQELHRLSVIAVGMFQRGVQALTGAEAAADLTALADGTADSDLLFGRFFFVHEARTVIAEQHLRSYEFMHATFGEHLAARLVDRTLRRLPDRRREGHTLPDDGALYALLSSTPLTDRAQVVRNLADLFAALPTDAERTALHDLLAALFRAVPWDTAHRTPHPHAPVRQTRVHRDAVYAANLLLLGVLAHGRVRASDYFGPDDPAGQWRRHTMLWQSQMSGESWDLYTSTLHPERIRLPDGGRDLVVGTGRVPFVQHDLGWVVESLPPDRPVEQAVDNQVTDVVRRLMFVGDPDAELLLNAAHPLLHQVPNALRTHVVDDGHVRSAAHTLLALFSRDTDDDRLLFVLLSRLLTAVEVLPSAEADLFMRLLGGQLVRGAESLSDRDLEHVVRRLASLPEGIGFYALWRECEEAGRDVLGRGGRELRVAVDALRSRVHTYTANTPTIGSLILEEVAAAGRTARSFGALPTDPRGPDHLLDRCLVSIDLSIAAARRPATVIDLLRLAVDLGRTDWLAAHTAELLVLLPDNAFGLLRPSDLGPLRAALPTGGYAYEAEFAEVEEAYGLRPPSRKRPRVALAPPGPPSPGGPPPGAPPP